MRKVITVQFSKFSSIGYKDPGAKKPEWYVTDVVKNEKIEFFTDIIKASDTSITLLCSDGEWAVVKLDAVANIEVSLLP